MKPTYLVLFSLIYTDTKSTILNRLEEKGYDVATDIIENAGNSSALNRGIGVIANDIVLLNNYGCWCSFQLDNYFVPRGQPVDEFDRYCRYLNEGYECILWWGWVYVSYTPIFIKSYVLHVFKNRRMA